MKQEEFFFSKKNQSKKQCCYFLFLLFLLCFSYFLSNRILTLEYLQIVACNPEQPLFLSSYGLWKLHSTERLNVNFDLGALKNNIDSYVFLHIVSGALIQGKLFTRNMINFSPAQFELGLRLSQTKYRSLNEIIR